MCGIAGFISKKNQMFDWEEIEKLLLSIEVRGRDATGIMWKKDGVVQILKANCTASRFVKLNELLKERESIAYSNLVLLHTRAATHGSSDNNTNNHPIYNGRGVLIHNGVVSTKQKFKSKGETDSEQLMLTIQNLGWEKGLNNTSGWLAIAYYCVLNKYLYLYRDGSPMSYTENEDVLAFSSFEHNLRALGIGQVVDKKIGAVLRIHDDTLAKKITLQKTVPGFSYTRNTIGNSEIERLYNNDQCYGWCV